MRRVAVVVAVVVLVVVVVPQVRARLKAVPTLADAVGVVEVRPLAPPVTSERTQVGVVPGRLDTPGWPAPAVLVVPGATPAGVDDQRVRDLATAVARSGRTVFTPELELYEWRLADEDITRVRAAARALHERVGSVQLLGFSFGGSLALVAAAELHDVDQVAVFGAYTDFVGVIQAATTGVATAGHVRMAWEPASLAEDSFESFIASLLGAGQARAVVAALDGSRAPDSLDDEAQRVYEVAANDDPDRTAALVDRLPDRVRETLARFSPVSVAGEVDARVVAMHSTNDPAVPYTEALRLAREFPDARVVTLRSFEHVDPTADGLLGWVRALPDAARATRFVGWMLAAQEPALPATVRRSWAMSPATALQPAPREYGCMSRSWRTPWPASGRPTWSSGWTPCPISCAPARSPPWCTWSPIPGEAGWWPTQGTRHRSSSSPAAQRASLRSVMVAFSVYVRRCRAATKA